MGHTWSGPKVKEGKGALLGTYELEINPFVRRLLDSPDSGGVAAVGTLAAELAEGVRRR